MLTRINKRIKALFAQGTDDKIRSRRGQIGIVLIFAAAVGLMLYAVTINIGRVSQGKVYAVMASNTTAAKMASFMASYGQALYMESLGGDTKVCGWTGFLVKLIGFIIAIVVLVISIVYYQGDGIYVALAILAAVFAGLSLAMELMIIQPGITKMWNKMIRDQLSTHDKVIEMGVQNGLLTAVTDRVNIPDLIDMDLDSFYGDLADPLDRESAPDYISRFAYFYTRRLQGVPEPLGGITVIDDFMAALADLIYGNGDHPEDTDGRGMFDPFDVSDCIAYPAHPCCTSDPLTDMNFPAMCDPCCIGDPLARPDCCNTLPPSCPEEGLLAGDWTTCPLRSPYRDATQYPYVYEVYHENTVNGFVSFYGFLGRDDEHHLYQVDPTFPNWDIFVSNNQTQVLPGLEGFDVEDTGGFYPADLKDSLFGTFYRISEWGLRLRDLTYGLAAPIPYGLGTRDFDNYQCHYCDVNVAPNRDCLLDFGVTLPTELLPQLSLPLIPGSQSPYSGGWCVDTANTGNLGDPPQVLDLLPGIPGVLAGVSQCAEITGGWKPGGDRFCDVLPPDWPYPWLCAKRGTCPTTYPLDDCACGDPGTAAALMWPDDQLDNFVYGMPEFYSWANEMIITYEASPIMFQAMFAEWYDEAAKWIECPCPIPPCACSYTEDPDGGMLYYWLWELQDFFTPIDNWVTTGYAGACGKISTNPALDAAGWCVPRPTSVPNQRYGILECEGVNPEERLTFDINGNSVRGEPIDVLSCLSWNGWDTDPGICIPGCYPPCDPLAGCPLAQGNAEKFGACAFACDNDLALAATYCAQLPRSLVPGFDVLPFVPANPAHAAAMNTCIASTFVASCVTNCNSLPTGYSIPTFVWPINPAWTDILELHQECLLCPSGPYSCVLDPSDPLTPFATLHCADDRVINCSDYSAVLNCECSWPSDMLGSCVDACYEPPRDFFVAVADAIEETNGSCIETDPGEWRYLLDFAIAAAANQVPKLRKRAAYLQPVVSGVTNIRNRFDSMILRLSDFLTGPALDLIEARDTDMDLLAPGSEAFAIYVWQDEADQDTFRPGLWHAVKVDVRAPGRCNAGCEGSWPWIKTYTKSWGLKRCYELTGTDGMVKARVIRFDEGRGGHEEITYADGTPLWRPRYGHPDAITSVSPGNIDATCYMVLDPILENPSLADWRWFFTGGGGGDGGWKNAFMLNFPPWINPDPLPANLPPYLDDADYRDCWFAVHEQMLMHGAESETCAMYFFGSSPDSFRVKFVPCDADFYNGMN